MKKSIISVLVINRFGVLTKVTMLFGRRGCNIHSLTVDTTHKPEFSRITVTVYESDDKVVQIFKQLKKLEDVKDVALFRDVGFIEREVALFKLNEGITFEELNIKEDEFIQIKNITAPTGRCVLEVVGTSEKVTELIFDIGEENIDRLSRSGSVAIGI